MMKIRGFTLLEVLLSLAFGVIVITLTLYLVQLGGKVASDLAVTEKSKYNEVVFSALIEKDFMDAEAVINNGDGSFTCVISGDSIVQYIGFDSLLIRKFFHLSDTIIVRDLNYINRKNTDLLESVEMKIKYDGELFPYVAGKHYSSSELVDYKMSEDNGS